MAKKKVCCLAGPRPSALPFGDREDDPRCIQLIQVLEEKLIGLITAGIDTFLCGLSQGVDTYFAELVLRLKERYPAIMLKCVLASEHVPDYWIECDRERYYRILAQSDGELYISRTHTQKSFTKRNTYMIANCDYLLIACSALSGGIREMVHLALKKNLPTIVVDINDLSIQEFGV